jgi:hypothetical protein
MATVAAVAHHPEAVLTNLHEAQHNSSLQARGRYGFSSINVDRGWVGRDMVGIDVGAAVLALDNYLMNGRARAGYHNIPCVDRGLKRLGFTPASKARPTRGPDESPAASQAS